MKKIISVFLIVLLCLSTVSVSAKTPLMDATKTMMGDTNNDSKVTAADARTVLRVASKLDPSDSVSLSNSDANGDEKISAADARLILRVAAGLSEFVYGFDGNGVPCAINVLNNNKYYLDVTYTDEASSDKITFSLAKDGDNIYLTSADMAFGLEDMGFSNCGMMINDNNIYAILGSDMGNIAMYIPESMSAEMGMTKEDLAEMPNMINAYIPKDLGNATATTINNKTVYRYTYEIDNQKCFLLVGSNGELLTIGDAGDDTTFIKFAQVSYDSADSYFDLSNYDLL